MPDAKTATNLFTNPDMMATDGEVVVWENLTTPDYRDDPDLTEIQNGDGTYTYTGKRVAGFAVYGDLGVVIQSSQWSKSGGVSARLIKTYPDTTPVYAYRVDSGGSPVYETDSQAIAVWRYQDRVLSGAQSSGMGTVGWTVGAPGNLIAPNEPGEFLARALRTDGNPSWRAYGARRQGESVWFDMLTLADTVDYQGPPFSGDTEPFEYLGQTVSPRWDDPSGNSTSSFKFYPPYDPWVTTVAWHEPKQRTYSVGVDRGMVYIDGIGHSWSGLVSVSRNAPDGELNKRYLDGVLYDVRVPKHDFEGSIEAFTYPRAFERCIGQQQLDGESIIAHNQPAIPFHLVYRTGIGDGIPDSDEYKIHILYNCYAQDSGVDYNTINSSPEADTFKFDIYSIPVHTSGIKPSAYFTIDSRDINRVQLEAIERVLYGADGSSPVLPDIEELRGFIRGDFY